MIRTQNLTEWRCSCGFRNNGGNKICGGNGNLGCNKQKMQSNQMPSVVYAMNSASSNSNWVCQCGFKNVAKNSKCGGNGNLGCDASRPPSGGSHFQKRSRPNSYTGYDVPSRKQNQTLSDGRWRCADCGFNNSENNDECGGNGRLGCNRSRIPMPIQPTIISIPTVDEDFSTISELFPPLESPPNNLEKADVSPWICACGFKNKAQNDQCGGRGPLGCNSSRPEQWTCICGFRNRCDNDKCGGSGPMGCDRLKPSLDETLPQVVYSPSSFGPYHGISSIYSSPIAMTDSAADNWVCLGCGFKNSLTNIVCGGNGTLGCNSVRPDPDTAYHAKSFANQYMSPVPEDWVCEVCRFRNVAQNDVCGGRGQLGCNSPSPVQKVVYVVAYQPDVVPTASDIWICNCGFQNRGGNELCGGKGPLGCGAAGPGGWRCATCGFKNRQDNAQCGGTGDLGCNAPLPLKNRKRKRVGEDNSVGKRQKNGSGEWSKKKDIETIDLT